MSRIGPRMRAVVSYVRDNPGCTKVDAGRYAARSEYNMGVVYGPVNRAITARLVHAAPGKRRNTYALSLTQRGLVALA